MSCTEYQEESKLRVNTPPCVFLSLCGCLLLSVCVFLPSLSLSLSFSFAFLTTDAVNQLPHVLMSMLYCPRWAVPSNCKPQWAPPFLVSVRYFVTATRKLTNTAGKAWWWVWPHPWWSASVRDVSIYSRPRNRERTVVRLDHKPQEPPPTTTSSEASPSESSTATPTAATC